MFITCWNFSPYNATLLLHFFLKDYASGMSKQWLQEVGLECRFSLQHHLPIWIFHDMNTLQYCWQLIM